MRAAASVAVPRLDVASTDVTAEDTTGNAEWDAFASSAPGGSYVQSSPWAVIKSISGWRATRIAVRREGHIVGGCQLLEKRISHLGSVAYAPRAPLVAADADADARERVLDELDAFGRSHRLLYVKIQGPVGSDDLSPSLARRGWVESGLEAGPTATVRVDLDRSPEAILGAMRSSVRRHVRKAEKSGVGVRVGTYDEIRRFWDLVEATSQRQGFMPFPVDYYQHIWRAFKHSGHSELLLVEYEGELLAGLFLIGFADTVWYKMGAWSGTRSDLHPNELGHWTAMQWARERGYRYYDFDGINPALARAVLAGEMPDEARLGTAHFKLGFGGDVVISQNAYDRSYRRLLAPPLRLVAPRLRQGRLSFRMIGRGS